MVLKFLTDLFKEQPNSTEAEEKAKQDSKPFDFVVFGPTGTVGYEVVFKGVVAFKKYRWAVAGRSAAKVSETIKDIEMATKQELRHVSIMEADFNNDQSMFDMISQAKVLINCCSPSGANMENILRICIACRTHYVDTTMDFVTIQQMHQMFNKIAEMHNVYIVLSCGFFGFSNEIIINIIDKIFDGTIRRIDCNTQVCFREDVDCASAIITKTLWTSMLKNYKNFLNTIYFPVFNAMGCLSRAFYNFISFSKSSTHVQFPVLTKATFPLGQPSKDKNSQMHIVNNIACGSSRSSLKFTIWMAMMTMLMCIPGLKWIPNYFATFLTGNAVAEDKVFDEDANSFTIIMDYQARGSKKCVCNRKDVSRLLKAKLIVPNPFYMFTSGALITSAVTLLEDYYLMNKGGVYTPGGAFKETYLVGRLEQFKNLYSFEIYEESKNMTRVLYVN